MRKFLLLFFVFCCCSVTGKQVKVGSDVLFTKEYAGLLKGKRIGVITNHTAVNHQMQSTIDLFKEHALDYNYRLIAFFAPEHEIDGSGYAGEKIGDSKDPDGVPIYSLHGETRRPTAHMLRHINLLVYDIQDIGSRSYIYGDTFFCDGRGGKTRYSCCCSRST